VVADGMGGHSAGEVASGTIINSIVESIFSGLLTSSAKKEPDECCRWIDDTIQLANRAVFDLGEKMGSDMGSTTVMAVANGDMVCIGNVGDSRAYLINRKGITQLTKDHSLVERLIETGQITRQEARTHPQRNVIYRTIGDKKEVNVDTSNFQFKPGDRLLLCSDGLNGMVDDDVIRNIVMEDGISPQDACEKLVLAAKAAGGDDNITVVVVEFS
jgi:protein phosphatase